MNKSRLNKLKKALKPDVKAYSIMAMTNEAEPENSTYTIWNGVWGSGYKKVAKEEFDKLKKQLPVNRVTTIVDDISRKRG